MHDSCFFIGHADAPSEIFPLIKDAIEHLINHYGVRQFFFENHGSFNRLVCLALAELKYKYPQIHLSLVTPYHPAVSLIDKPDQVDDIFYPFEKPVMPRYAILHCNKKMIRDCGFLIAYVCHTGKARDFLEYALRRQKTSNLYIRNLGSMQCGIFSPK